MQVANAFRGKYIDIESNGNVRAVSRALDVLRAINLHRALSMTEISNKCDLPYGTAFRIVETLLAERVIERVAGKKLYRPTIHVMALSIGYQDVDAAADAAPRHLA